MAQGNPNPIVPHEAAKATQFRSGYDPRRHGPKVSTKFIAQKLTEEMKDGRTPNDEILDHLIEVATKWEVIVKGSGDEPMPVASARDSVEAAKLLWSYALGRAGKAPEESQLAKAEHFLSVEKNRFAFALQLLGERAKSMSEGELANFFNSLVVAKPESVEMFVRLAAGEEPPQQQTQQQTQEALTAPPTDDESGAGS